MAINAKTNNAMKTLALTNDISNPNLLINPDFKINQRGQSTYSISPGSGYTVDRWKLWNGILTVNSDGTVTFKNVSGQQATLVQILENPCTEECYASIYVTSITGKVLLYTEDLSGKYAGVTKLKYGLNYVQFTGCKTFAIGIEDGDDASITIKYTKLEKGTNVTQFIEPDLATELLKCQRYHQGISVDTKTCTATNNMAFSRIYGIFMRKPVTATLANDGQPKQIYVNSTTYKINSIEFATIDYNNELYLSITLASNVGNARYVGSFYPFAIVLDAEIY